MDEAEPLIVGIDIGTNCGYSVLDGKHRLESGTWRTWNSYRDKRDKTPSWARWKRAREAFGGLLDDLAQKHPGRRVVVVVEDVRRHGGTRAAHVYGGLRALIELEVGKRTKRGVSFRYLGVSEWKKLATGKGNATKQVYVVAMNTRFKLRMDVAKREDEAAALGVAEAYRLLRKQGKQP